MGLSYHFKFSAPATRTAAELETFLRTVEKEAQALGFKPTMVLNARFDNPERRAFARRLTTGYVLESDRLKESLSLREDQVWDHSPRNGECRIIPKQGVVLVVTDERGCEAVFGFFRYPAILQDRNGAEAAVTGLGGRWIFRDHAKTPDPRIRRIIRKFAEAGYLEEERDDFGVVFAA
jgi:hypothetical protein